MTSKKSIVDQDKVLDSIVERLAKKVDSLNYQNIDFNKKCRQQAKDEIKALLLDAGLVARIDELNRNRDVNIDVKESKDFARGFDEAINQVVVGNDRRIEQLNAQLNKDKEKM